MKVLIVNTLERRGGAAVAAGRLMKALQKEGVEVSELVLQKTSDNPSVSAVGSKWCKKLAFVWERLFIWTTNCFHKKNLFAVSIANSGFDITRTKAFQEADIIHLHWINQGLLSLSGLRKVFRTGKAVVWTMHDMWPFTGICHHSGTCDQYFSHCHRCPQLSQDCLSSRVLARKKELYSGKNISFVACSQWLKERASHSPLTQQHILTDIPNPIDISKFQVLDQNTARLFFNLPQDKRLILFGSVKNTDKRKGIDYFIEACRWIYNQYPDIAKTIGIAVYGSHSDELQAQIPIPVYSLGYISSEEALVNLYNAVDVFVTPSLEENLPNTIMEAMACGTPCVGFQIGGIPEMIDHLKNGYVSQYKSAEDLAKGIHWVLDDADYESLSIAAREKVIIHYSEPVVAHEYMALYRSLLESKNEA